MEKKVKPIILVIN